MLTVLMASRNGAHCLPRTLDAICRLEAPDGGWKLVIADNASTDATPKILASYLDKLPLTIVNEKRIGKNAALNTALPHRAGDLVVFTDDDVLVAPSWLRLLRAAADAHPDYTVFGGPVEPEWEKPPPQWVLDWVPLGTAFSLLDWPQEGPIAGNLAFGPNMAVREKIFAHGRRFNESIGPQGNSYAMGSETEFLMRLQSEGHQSWFCKHAVVRHIIRPHQLEPAWLFGRARRSGRGEFRLLEAKMRLKTWMGVPRYLLRGVLEKGLRSLANRLAGDRRAAFQLRWEMNFMLGKAIESRRMVGAVPAAKEEA